MRCRIAVYISLALIGFLGFTAQSPARAADQVVTDCVNYTGPNVDVPITLDEAVANAIATGGGTITFACPAGTVIVTNFEMFISLNSVTIDGGNNVTIDANGTNRVAYVNGGGAALTLQNITIRNGRGGSGGAILNEGTLTLDNVTVQNSLASEGGGIYNSAGRPLIISNSTFTGNQAIAVTLYGGAIFNAGTATISNTSFTGSGFGATRGAGIYNIGMASLTNVSFSNNYATDGGGIYNGGMLGIIGGSFTNNTALTSGGAVFNAGIMSSQNVIYTNNTCVNTAITDNGGNTRDGASTGCPGAVLLAVNATCIGAVLQVTITAGDPNFNVIVNGITFYPNVGAGIYSVFGPVNFNNVTVEELSGDFQIPNLGNFTCHNTLAATSTCIGEDLQVTITNGDALFNIVDDNSILRPNNTVGSHLIDGPISTTNLRVVELGGNTETLALTDQNCFLSEILTATAVCNGANLDVTISNGNAPFTINVNGTVTTGNALGVYNYTGPNTFNVIVTEETGDGEIANLLPVTCTTPIVPVIPVAPVVLSPDTTALGCDVTSSVGITADNTYCRILMTNGAVVNYAGAVPQSLINLGVKLAVDVYRLQGGQSITDFGGYSRVCLAGQGRLFYLDARTSPRTQTELATESDGNFTCGWIPAAGTLVLTN